MINRTILQGRLTADIELRQTASGIDYAEFTVAWSEKYKEVETKCFLRCKAWRGTAKFVSEYFSKGKEIAIEGQMVTEQWQADGENKSRTICVVDKAHFCGGKKDAENVKTDDSAFIDIPEDADEEIPFK